MSRIDAFGLARQTAGFGTKVSTMEYFPPVETSEPDTDNTEIEVNETSGTRFPTGIEYGTLFHRIPVSLAPRMDSLPRLLSGALGQPTTTTPTAPAKLHTFDPTAAGKVPEPHSMFVVRKDPSPAIVDLFWDALVDSFSIDFAANDVMKANFNYVALDLDDTQAAPTVTSDISKRRVFTEVVVYFDSGAGEAAIKCQSAGVTYSNNLDTDEAILGTRKLYALPYGNADCEVRFSPREALAAHYRRAMTASPTTCTMRIVATGATITGAEKQKVEIDIAAFEYLKAPAAVSGAEVLKMVEVTGRAKLSDTTSKFVTVLVENTVATY